MCNDCGNVNHDPATQGLDEDLVDEMDLDQDLEGPEEWDDDQPTPEELYGGEDEDYLEDEPVAIDAIANTRTRTRWGFKIWYGICQRPIRGTGPDGQRLFGHWRKHLYKKHGDRLVCRRCGEVKDPNAIPF